MNEEFPEIDIEALFQRMQPPDVPDSIFAGSFPNILFLKGWDKLHAVQVISGLLTVPDLHANGIRLDWLLRLVISKANGSHKVLRKDLVRVLNKGLAEAGVNRLEDPNEDLFCDLVATRLGNFRIFPGQWELAAPYTQTLIEAFERLPDAPPKTNALKSVHALLALSNMLAERASVDRTTLAGSHPFVEIKLPTERELRHLAGRSLFTGADLEAADIGLVDLLPFILTEDQFHSVADREIGNTPLELRPLLSTPDGILIANPTSISLAIRALLVETATTGGMAKTLLYGLLRRQERYAESTGFWPDRRLELSPPTKHGLRGVVSQYDEGCYVHVLQMPTSFENFPEDGFTTVRALPADVSQFIADDIARFWNVVEKQGDCRRSITVLMLSGWGVTHSFTLPVQDANAPGHWLFSYLTFADAAVLGACDGGKLTDIIRLLSQSERLERDGFSFMNANGLINLFGFWQTTDGNLIPEHMTDIKPPTTILMGTNELLEPRTIGANRRDYRAMARPDGDCRLVQRTEWGDDGEKTIYASLDDLAEGRLAGAIHHGGRTWWIESEPREGERRDWRYQVWNAVLQWLAVVGPTIINRLPELFPSQPAKILLQVPRSSVFETMATAADAQPLSAVITIQADEATGIATVTIGDGWLQYLRSPQNIAEIELIAAVLEALVNAGGEKAARDELSILVQEIIGSTDWRWLHAYVATKPMDRLAGHGLIDQFKAIPRSASYLVKCGSIWAFRDRAEALEITGEAECKAFLTEYRDVIQDSLIGDIRQFSRAGLVEIAARDYQAARHEQSRWKGTIRALRAIRGDKADDSAFARQNEINAVQRAAKAILEIAACEAPERGAEPSEADVEELYAKALLLAGNSQLFASIRAGVLPPSIHISPAGDLLTERDVLMKIMEPGAVWLTKRTMDEASASYLAREDKEEVRAEERLAWTDDLRRAVEAEYGVPAEAYVDFQFAMTQAAEEREAGIFVVRHSELAKMLEENPSYPDAETSSLLKRLTLPRRPRWTEGLSETNTDIGRFDRPVSLINRPLLSIDDSDDPLVLVSPVLISDSIMYSLSGLLGGNLQGAFWESLDTRSYAGAMAKAEGEKFEEAVADKLNSLGLEAKPRQKLSALLNQKVSAELGDIDVFALSADRTIAWVIEAKSLRLCRTEAEASSRMSEYRGRLAPDSKGRDKPDKLLRHIRRVQYMRDNVSALQKALKLSITPAVKGLLVVDSPQPMNFHMLEDIADGDSVFLAEIEQFGF